MRTMWKAAGIVVAVAVTALPAVAQGPGRGHGQGMGMGARMMGPGPMGRNPAEVVLDHREQLELTAEQVAAVEAIRDRVEAENAPRVQAIMDAIGDVVPSELSIQERHEFRQKLQELRPLHGEMRATNQAAGKEIHELLNDDQEKALVGIMHGDRPGRGQNRPMRGRRGPRGGGGAGAGWR